ncbi:ATPase family AAA domain-containing protein 2 isoform X2 [Kryptolebias marmoratus]|uniref:ATPase family AAA domain-containing protein 2-like n=1 Tax=Kryptolebias marmoratus TaxID=37003 RepID=A0A3Q3A0G2_KRYMA|nr:ATPase family AAA domain-containing protein 2 isoform X2 [Kryptolebias marmoratus]
MVTLRGKGRGDAVQSSGPPQRQLRSAVGSKTPPRPAPETRSRITASRPQGRGVPNGLPAEEETFYVFLLDSETHKDDDPKVFLLDPETHKDEDPKPARNAMRKSSGHQKLSGGRRSGLRRSSRPTKLTSRYQASNALDGFSSNTPSSMLKKMDNMKRKRLVSDNKEGKIYSKAQKRRTPVPPQRDLSDSEDGNGRAVDEDSGNGTAADEDSNSSVNQNLDAKLSRASSLYQGPSSEFQKGTLRISASGPNTTRRGAFRSTRSNHSDDDSTDDEDEKASSNCRPLGLRTELFSSRRDKMSRGAGLADIDPMAIDQSVGFDSIGGLSGHISALKEMVVFPLLYPEVFDNFKIQPPRGCLFYGPPGTGKTLVARALANECSHGNRKVSFFMRKGADCLSKWVGESERQLRLLFEQAFQKRPSIIFFDEIDGLAPVRSSRQDQIHSSIVSTLLALMDGLDSRGEVVVIGATNRLDSIDPALRRPGRFDREFLFSLPDRESRKEILKIHTRQWKPPPSEEFLDELAEKCVGYCGADIKAVCTEAALCALRRRYPQIYGTSQKLLLDVSSISVSSCDFVTAIRKMKPASQRSTACPAKPLSPVVQPLLGAALRHILEVLQRLFPHAEQGMKRKREPDLTSGILDDGLMSGEEDDATTCSISAPSTSQNKNFLYFARSAVKHPTSHRPRMLLAGRPESGQTSHLAPAVLHALERFTVHSLDSAVLFGVSCTSPEEACAQVFCEAKRTAPSILYIPHIQQWWETAGPALRASFLSLLESIPSFSPILLLATCSIPHQQLDPEIQFLFREEYGEVYTMSVPTRKERTDFFHDLIVNQAAEPPPSNNKTSQTMEILPVAPLPPPRQMSEQERLRLEEQEEDVLRELRLFLRNVTERLMLDRRFKAFTKPVDIEEVPDYLLVIKKPMDLSTLLSNIDEQKYITVSEFMSDADLIWQNALEYNPDSDPLDRHIRHRACALKDTIRAIIRDELDEDFARVCEEIRESRIQRVAALSSRTGRNQLTNGVYRSVFSRNSHGPRARKKKRYKKARKSKWSNGVIRKPKKKKPPASASNTSSSSSSSKANSDSSTEEVRGVKTRVVNGSAGLSSSSMSESSDEEQSQRTVNAVTRTHNVLVNGFNHPKLPRLPRRTPKRRLNLRPRTRSSETAPAPLRTLKRAYLNKLETRRKQDRENKAALEQMQMFSRDKAAGAPEEKTPPLVADHNKLKELLNRAVAKTEGAEVEPLEKLYALVAQSIYRHRNNYNKTELIKEMKSAIDSFS